MTINLCSVFSSKAISSKIKYGLLLMVFGCGEDFYAESISGAAGSISGAAGSISGAAGASSSISGAAGASSSISGAAGSIFEVETNSFSRATDSFSLIQELGTCGAIEGILPWEFTEHCSTTSQGYLCIRPEGYYYPYALGANKVEWILDVEHFIIVATEENGEMICWGKYRIIRG